MTIFRTLIVGIAVVPMLTACDLTEKNNITTIHQGYSETAPQYEVNGRIISNIDVRARSWNARGKSAELKVIRALFLTHAYNIALTDAEQARATLARQKYADAIVINSLMASGVGIVAVDEAVYEKGLKRNQNAGMTVASTTLYGFKGDGEMPLLERIERSKSVVDKLGMALVENTQTIRQAKKDNNMAVIFNSQGADYVIDDLTMVKTVKDRGLQISNFTYNNNSALAGGGTLQDMGVTELGREFIKHANNNKLILDCSHSSNQTCIDTAKYSQKPILATHSNPSAVYDISRNMSDAAIKAVASTGGNVCSAGLGLFLNSEGNASPEDYAKHVDYTANLIGRDRTCYATDYLHNAYDYAVIYINSPDVYPPEKGYGVPVQNLAAEHIWAVVAVLEDKYQWSDTDVRGFLGENLMRVYQANWE